MGMSVGAGAKGGRRRRGVPRYGAMADINMTPFIDVMLVLLIIFMVAAPLMTAGVPLDLPKTEAGPINVDQNPVIVSIDKSGDSYVNEALVTRSQLNESVLAAAKGDKERRVIIRGHRLANFEAVIQVVAQLQNAGFSKSAFKTEPLEDSDFRK